jgi:PPOX class probable F420-dependent enzyme
MPKKSLSERARAFLEERRYAVLATINENGSPQTSVMWYMLDGDTIVMNTKAGRVKHRNMVRDPRISLCFEEGEIYVAINGSVEMIDDPEIAQRDIYLLALRYNGEEIARRQMADQFSKEHRVTLHLRFEHIVEDLSE